jgi:hypothetical protein
LFAHKFVTEVISGTSINALLPANVNSQAAGINNANNIVGFYQLTSTTSIATQSGLPERQRLSPPLCHSSPPASAA